jgi:Domain of unknown function (DUF1707)
MLEPSQVRIQFTEQNAHNELSPGCEEVAMPLDEDGPDPQPPPAGSGEFTPAPRASDADREAALERLRTAFVDGLLTDEEFDQRAHAALTARSTGGLERLLVDLPLTSATSTPSTTSDQPVRFTMAILGETQRRWRWRVAPRLTAVCVLGGCVLDLRAATFTAPVTTITAVAVLSGVDVLVPPGVRVELSVYGLFGDAGSLVPEQDLPPDAPLVRVRCFALLGGVEAKPRLRRDMRAIDPRR